MKSKWEPKSNFFGDSPVEGLLWYDTLDNRYRCEISDEDDILRIYDHKIDDVLIHEASVPVDRDFLWSAVDSWQDVAENFIDNIYTAL